MIDRPHRARTRRPAAGLLATLALCATAVVAGCAPAPGVSEPASSSNPAYVQHLAADRIDDWRAVHFEGLVLDVRSLAEWDDPLGHLDGATNVPVEELESRVGELARWKSAPVLVYDKDGTRTTRAGQVLVTNGFHDVSVIDGGLKAYRDWQAKRTAP